MLKSRRPVSSQRSELRAVSGLRAQGVTPRAVLLGLLLVPILTLWTLYSEIVAQSTELAVMSLSIAAVFVLLLLLWLNVLLKRWMPRFALTRAELLFVYIMQTTSITICGVGMMQFLNVGLANVFWYSTPENGWAGRYFSFFRRWAFPDPHALRGYYLGQSSLFTWSHLSAWIAPILTWTLFLLLLLGVMFCLNVLVRRRWVEQERLSFPITAACGFIASFYRFSSALF